MSEWEQIILNQIDFQMDSYPVIYDIVEIILSQGILFSSDFTPNSSSVQTVPRFEKSIIEELERYVDFFTLLSVQDFRLVNMNPYLVSCAIVSASRKYVRLTNSWP
jgi:hypothetical protein